jgi:hypothetical protein
MVSKFQTLVLSALLLVGGPLAVSLLAEDENRSVPCPLNSLFSIAQRISLRWQMYGCLCH